MGFRALRHCARSGLLAFAALVFGSARVSAQSQLKPPAAGLGAARPGDDLWQPKESSAEVRLEAPPGFSLGLGAYGGLALVMTQDESHPHTIAGVLSRARYGYVEVGASLEFTERTQDEWRAIGGFIGAWLPYRNWVDFELAGGFAFRRYLNSDPRYGSGGYDVRCPAFTLRLGVSDRSSEALFGARVGGEIVAAMDLGAKEAQWRYELGSGGDATVFRGSTPVGGFSIGIAVSTGFDVAFKSRKTPAVSATSASSAW